MSEDESGRAVEAARTYVESELETPVSEYRLTYEGVDYETGFLVVDATHDEDLHPVGPVAPGAGSGKSWRLLVDPETMTVRSRLGFQ